MSTSIEWTDATWNPVTGCSKVSPGCAHCYAETVALRFWPTQYPPVPIAIGQDGEMSASRPRGFTDVQCHDDRLEQPLRWRRPRRVFVNSMSDLFHEDVPDEFIDRVFAVMALAPQHTFQVLTKRAERMRDYLLGITLDEARSQRFYDACDDVRVGGGFEAMDRDWPLSNVWLGVSVENQRFADERIPLLLDTPAAVRFVSAEPLLAPVGFYAFLDTPERNECLGILGGHKGVPGLDWVIIGGESGADARPFRVQWARAILAQCLAAKVACFVKQLGSNLVDDDIPGPSINPATGARTLTVRQTITIRDRKGGDPAEWPADIRVREFPAVAQ